MLRSLLVFWITSICFLGAAQAANSVGPTNLYIVVSAGSASLLGRFSTRAKCIEAAAAASQDVTTVNSSGNPPQNVAVLLCVPSGN